jgi:hypothetical protein
MCPPRFYCAVFFLPCVSSICHSRTPYRIQYGGTPAYQGLGGFTSQPPHGADPQCVGSSIASAPSLTNVSCGISGSGRGSSRSTMIDRGPSLPMSSVSTTMRTFYILEMVSLTHTSERALVNGDWTRTFTAHLSYERFVRSLTCDAYRSLRSRYRQAPHEYLRTR